MEIKVIQKGQQACIKASDENGNSKVIPTGEYFLEDTFTAWKAGEWRIRNPILDHIKKNAKEIAAIPGIRTAGDFEKEYLETKEGGRTFTAIG